MESGERRDRQSLERQADAKPKRIRERFSTDKSCGTLCPPDTHMYLYDRLPAGFAR
jgi:hypothetical protein